MSRFFSTYRDAFFRLNDRVSFAWDDWNYTDYFYFEDTEFSAKFVDASFTGCRGFIIAAAELIAVRMHPFVDVSPTLAYLDAAWVSMLEDGICDYAVLSRSDWAGPNLGPLRAGMLVVNDALFDAVVDGDIRARCSFIHNLLQHVLEDHQLPTYDKWVKTVLLRLRSDHSNRQAAVSIFQETMPLGAPCAPETFIVEQPFSPEQAEKALVAHRQRLERENPWLLTEPLRGIVG